MSQFKLAIASVAMLAAAGLAAPALAAAPAAKLTRSPSAFMAPSVGKDLVGVIIRTDRALQRRRSGAIAGGVRLDGHVASLSRVGRSGSRCYVAYVKDPGATAGSRAAVRVFVTQGDSPHYDRRITIGRPARDPRSC
jgi:hypothetical protein